MERIFHHDIIPEIKERWSPRAIDSQKIEREDVMALLEAARYAPSCYNEQPWRFIIADDEPALTMMRSILLPLNQVWANQAPVLILIVSKKTFSWNGDNNYWNMFDAGAAWGYLSLEAQKRKLVTHAMGGFSQEEARKVFDISEEYNVIAVVAIGKYGRKEDLDEELQKREYPEIRKEIRELLL